ncbi:hypothetical protein ANANG_G00061940 [Anguilla anguilla]|uniref:General transcription factor IIE subunit 1 n=1 Tax=Anguilla anguilla TaxID=7936 RepID=A0A9D3MR04_ANGAN|nr:hypothetical protein ANANG_G00061940 [Anguilla anguilla]
MEPELLTEVPAALKRLAKQVVRGFYGVEHALALDILIRNPCVREEDMLELLKFDRKQLRSVLNTLKADKFVKCRMRVETAPDGKTTRHNYYFINYRLLVNVVKYKLDHMRRRIETDERDSTNRASFRCPCCSKTFTDLEANQLFDPMTGTFRCTFCQTEVEEDESALPKKDARTLVARFNEQIEPIYVLLRETEDVNLSHDLLEPEPAEIPALKQSRDRAAQAAAGAAGRGPGGRGPPRGVVVEGLHASEGKAPRERPVWLTESTVQGAYSDADALNNVGEDMGAHRPGDGGREAQPNENEERLGERHQRIGRGLPAAPAPRGGPREEEVEDEEEDEFEEVGEEEPTVLVGGRPFSYHDVSQRPELVEQMSPQEKEAYIEMGRNLFQNMFF